MFSRSFQRFTDLDKIDLSAIELKDFIRKFIPRINLLDGINIKPIVLDNPVHAKCELLRLGEGLINLINNSVEAISGSGEVMIRLSDHPRDRSLVMIAVEDKGDIKPKHLQDIWKPFFTT